MHVIHELMVLLRSTWQMVNVKYQETMYVNQHTHYTHTHTQRANEQTMRRRMQWKDHFQRTRMKRTGDKYVEFLTPLKFKR